MIVAIVCAVLGLLLIYLEFFLPGAVLGIGGGVMLIASIFLFLASGPKVFFLLTYIFALIFLVFLVIKLALRSIRKTKSNNTFFLDDHQEGYVASEHLKQLYGKTAEAASDLKPSGYIDVDKEYYQAVSIAGYIKKGDKVQIIGGEGSSLKVKKI